MLCVQPVTHHKPKKVDYEGLCNVVVFGSGWKLNLCDYPVENYVMPGVRMLRKLAL